MPEWYLAIVMLAGLSLAGRLWEPLLIAIPFLVAAIGALLADAALGASRARFSAPRGPRLWRLRALTGALYLLQPLARLGGRLRAGLTPLRRRGPRALALPLRRTYELWSEQWQSTEDRVRGLAAALRAGGSVVRSGGDWDRWDLQIRGGLMGVARVRLGIEEHGSGRQLIRVRAWPYAPRGGILLGVVIGALSILGWIDDREAAASLLGLVSFAILARLMYECGNACATIAHAVRNSDDHG
jgi:hypothetical protein